MALNYVTVTGTFDDGSGTPLSGTVTFTPSETVYYAGIPVVSAANPIAAQVIAGVLKNPQGGTLQLLATDNTGVTFEGLTGFWFWNVSVNVGGTGQSWSFFLPHTPATVDLYTLANTGAGGVAYLPLTGGTLTGAVVPAVSALTDAATIAVNAALGNVFTVTLGGNRTMGAPSNPVPGQTITFHLTQDAAGSRTVTWNAAYDFGTAGAPTLTTAAGKVDLVGFTYDGGAAKWCCLGSGLGF